MHNRVPLNLTRSDQKMTNKFRIMVEDNTSWEVVVLVNNGDK